MKRLDLLRPGTVVGRYKVMDVLGQGGMAVVYRVRHDSLGSLHALKVTAVPSRSILRRLQKEGEAQARVKHRHIVAVHDVLEVEGCPGLLMEYVAGPSLEELLERGPLALPQVDRLARGILRGMRAAHSAGLVHRDLKPANVLIAVEEEGWVPKVADFGLVKDTAETDGQTRSGSYMGTPQYMAPEQIRDSKSVDARADIFALGAILYEMLSGARAFEGEDLLEVFNQVALGDYVPLVERRPDAPERMQKAIASALQIDPDARPADLDALLELWCGDVSDAAIAADAETVAQERCVPVRPMPRAADTAGLTQPTIEATIEIGSLGTEPPAAVVAHTPMVASMPPTPASAAPASRRLWPVALGGFVVAGGLAFLGAGALGVSAMLGMQRIDEPAEVLPPPRERPEPLAVPALPEPEPEPASPEPEPQLELVAPVPAVAPVPQPAPVAQPKEAPAPAPAVVAPVPVPELPEPQPVAVPAPSGTFRVIGEMDVLVRRVGGTETFAPGTKLAPGQYQVQGVLAAGEPPTDLLQITIEAGTTVELRCEPSLRGCREQ